MSPKRKKQILRYLKEKVAIALYNLGVKPYATTFIDGETTMYGYGKCHTYGAFEYHLPAKYVESKKEDKKT